MPLDQEEDKPAGEKEMSFLDHLEELRWHIIKSAIAILVFSIAAFILKDFFFGEVLLGPAKPSFITYRLFCQLGDYLGSPALCIDKLNFILQSRQMSGQFAMHITGSVVIGLVCAFPYVFFQVWKFVSPGLYPKERKATRGAVFWVSFLFLIGVLFGYFLVTPLSVNFLANYTVDPSITNQFDITSYISTVVMLVLACGLMFQLPIAVFVLTKIGVVTPAFMREYRRHAIIVILVVAAVITPPDIFSQLLVTFPLYALYEVSIFVSAYELRRLKKQELEL